MEDKGFLLHPQLLSGFGMSLPSMILQSETKIDPYFKHLRQLYSLSYIFFRDTQTCKFLHKDRLIFTDIKGVRGDNSSNK